MNVISPTRMVAVSDMLWAGRSIRAICRATGAAKNTVLRYKDILGVRAADIRCGCGKPSTHRGWCSPRFANSPARQEFMRRWHAASIDGEKLFLRVWTEVAKFVGPDRRADACQEAMLGILEGRFRVETLKQNVRALLKSSVRIIDGRGTISADQKRYEDGEENIIDGISNEQYHEAFE